MLSFRVLRQFLGRKKLLGYVIPLFTNVVTLGKGENLPTSEPHSQELFSLIDLGRSLESVLLGSPQGGLPV